MHADTSLSTVVLNCIRLTGLLHVPLQTLPRNWTGVPARRVYEYDEKLDPESDEYKNVVKRLYSTCEVEPSIVEVNQFISGSHTKGHDDL